MRAVLQRVRAASVSVNGHLVGAIEHGLLALVGVAKGDGPADVAYIATKICDIRIFEDLHGKMNRSVADAAGSLLVVSQFTLYADARKGRRPSFDGAAPPAIAAQRFGELVDTLRRTGVPVATGVFQAEMQVTLINDGPVTVLLDSSRLF